MDRIKAGSAANAPLTHRYKDGGLALNCSEKDNRLTLAKKGAGYFFMFLTITIINPIKLTISKPKVSITIIES